MFRPNPLLWPKSPAIWGYGTAILSVSSALIISQWPPLHLETAPASLFLCAVMITAWFGGVGPGLFETALSSRAFDYFFLSPIYSLAAKPGEIPRLAIFTASALFVGSLSAAQRSATESLKHARDDLKGIVQELQRSNEALHAESLERKHAEEAQADLARVSRVTTMGELTASLAHEVNQPIAAAVTNGNTCLRWLTREHPDIEEARVAEIISRIRLLFKKGTPQRELVDVGEVVREMIVLLRGEASRHKILVGTELVADIPQNMGDCVQLQQLLTNLMLNGSEATKDVDGKRELVIRSQRGENGEELVSVSDTGVGLPVQQADHIFKPFLTTKLQGTGMGLSISRSIVASHGGRLWAADNPPRGASFYFTLPTKLEAKE